MRAKFWTGILPFAKQDPSAFGFIVIFAVVMLVFAFVIYLGYVGFHEELEMIENASCHDLEEMIADKDFVHAMTEAKHVYEWGCER